MGFETNFQLGELLRIHADRILVKLVVWKSVRRFEGSISYPERRFFSWREEHWYTMYYRENLTVFRYIAPAIAM
jgi:hypothetical protein